MGRRDSLTASKSAANKNIPGPNSDVRALVDRFNRLGLSPRDMVALSGVKKTQSTLHAGISPW